jgi:DMSO/TMAO reductase YedYZ molybdopterin-dependent catalytic subunit
MVRYWKLLGWMGVVVMVVMLFSCAPAPARSGPVPQEPVAPTETPAPPTPEATLAAVSGGTSCNLPPIVVPTPAEYPGYTSLDPSTGLHVTGRADPVDLTTWRLRVSGLVDHPLELTYDEIRCLPKVEASPNLVCPGFFMDKATWAGAPIADVLALAGVQAGAQKVEFVSVDGYRSSLSLEEALDRANFLAYEWEGEPLPHLHGFPLRLVIPTADGGRWAKWLVELRVK